MGTSKGERIAVIARSHEQIMPAHNSTVAAIAITTETRLRSLMARRGRFCRMAIQLSVDFDLDLSINQKRKIKLR